MLYQKINENDKNTNGELLLMTFWKWKKLSNFKIH